MTLAEAFSWALVGLALICTLIAVSIGVQRVTRRRRARRIELLLDPLRESVYDVVTGEPDEVEAALATLRRVDDAAWPPLQDLLVEMFAKVRGEALAPVLSLLDERGVLRRVRHDLRSRSAVTRAHAAYLLGLVQDRGARPALERLLADRDAEVRIVACRALGQIGDAAAAPSLLGTIAATRPVPAGVVGAALLGLGSGVERAVLQALDARDATTREIAIDTAGLRGLVGLVPTLRQRLSEEPEVEVRARAATALGRIGSSDALPELIAATGADQPPAVRVAAAEALGALGDPDALPTLTPLLDAPALLADTAAGALVELGPPGLAALRDRVEPGRPSAAAGALALAALRSGGELS